MTDLDTRAAALREMAYNNCTADVRNEDFPAFAEVCSAVREEYKKVAQAPLRTPLVPRTPEKVQARDLLRFEDAEFIEQVYLRVLRRDADGEGGSEYLQKLRSGEMTKEDVIFCLRMSREGRKVGAVVEGVRATHPKMEPLTRNNGYRFVEDAYNWLLGRKADAAGLKTSLKLLRKKSKKEFLEALAVCPERADLQPRLEAAAAPDRAVEYSELMRRDDADFIIHLYSRVLGRAPDAPNAARYLAELRLETITKDDVLFSIRMSEEGRQRDVFIDKPALRRLDVDRLLALDAEAFISAIYMWVFGRPADQAGLSHNLGLMRGGMSKREMLLALLGSGEAAGKPVTEYILRRLDGTEVAPERAVSAEALAAEIRRADADLRHALDLRAMRREFDALTGKLNEEIHALKRQSAAASIRTVVAQRRATEAQNLASDAMNRLAEARRQLAEQAAALQRLTETGKGE